MPELPEVETVRLALLDRVVGRAIVGLRGGSFADVMGGEAIEHVSACLRGLRITAIRRRGKYLLFDLDDASSLVVHLRMTGNLLLSSRDEPPARFEHLAIELDNGSDLRFSDQRKFGRVLHVSADAAASLARRLGPEPLDGAFTSAALATGLSRRSGKLKSALLDQELVAGLGNIYVDEALFRARLHPERVANSLSDDETRRLHRAIRAVLREGLSNRGTTISTFRDALGEAGVNGSNLRVYGRGGTTEPCPRCGGSVVRLVVGGRGTHLCPRCQPRSVGYQPETENA
jgi:formamidopyrimidine-DNA glycosylase